MDVLPEKCIDGSIKPGQLAVHEFKLVDAIDAQSYGAEYITLMAADRFIKSIHHTVILILKTFKKF